MNMKMIWNRSTLFFIRKGDQHCRVGIHYSFEEGKQYTISVTNGEKWILFSVSLIYLQNLLELANVICQAFIYK